MLWETFLTGVSTALGIGNLVTTGYIFGLIITLGFIAAIALSTRSSIATVLTGYGFLLLFTVAGWIDAWVLILTVVGTAGVYAFLIKGVFS